MPGEGVARCIKIIATLDELMVQLQVEKANTPFDWAMRSNPRTAPFTAPISGRRK
jgi:hypothetical protein